MEGYYPSGVKGANPSITPTGSLLRALAVNSANKLDGYFLRAGVGMINKHINFGKKNSYIL